VIFLFLFLSTMKKLLLVLLFLPFCGFSQIKNCATDILQERLKLAKPDRAIKENQFNNKVIQAVANNSVKRIGDITIPVVVHIIHQNGNENISDALVIEGIEHLNQAFSNTGNFQDADGVDTHIRFCLAQQDEYGFPSYGITRHFSSLTNLIAETQDEELKSLVHWNPLQYLNIYLVNEITSSSMGAGVAGYAYFPSSHGMPEDGIVNEARWFGSSVDNSKVHIHEAGHYLGLYHTFNGGCNNNNCLFDGDKVCDTPPDASTSAVNCDEVANTCTTDSDDNSTLNPFRPVALGGLGDQPDMFVNYMDYGFQDCQHLFTAGQSERINATLTTERASLLLSTGCDNACWVYADFTGLPSITINPGISFPLVGIHSGDPVNTFSWLVNGIEVATTQEYIFTAPYAGNYTITFRVVNPVINCFKDKTIIVNAVCGNQLTALSLYPANPLPGESVLFTGSFGPGTISAQWQIDGIPEAFGGANFNHTFQVAGEYYVSFITSNGTCSDTSNIYVPVGQCNGGEALTWRFGAGNILTFYGDNPIQGVLPETLFNQEGIGNICDVNGNLILYSDGVRAFNGQDVQLQNDTLLSGGPSSSQAALIVPNPSDNNLYYIFTTGDGGFGELHYATADISQNEIISDVLLTPYVTEKLTAVKHCNANDTWVVCKKFNSFAFYAYLVTDAGVIETPVVSFGGTEQINKPIGCMKFSPEGNKLALAVMR
jgi:PKD repeat protein